MARKATRPVTRARLINALMLLYSQTNMTEEDFNVVASAINDKFPPEVINIPNKA